ncbi:uncharacterized protein TNCV_1541651 [Trichonephila clavipes]|nr:uncharacterized protein TNCV_1541651 [Trichonephila clavipes]
MSACEREFHIACMRSNNSSFEAAGRGSRAKRRPTKSRACSIGDIFGDKQAKEEVVCIGHNRSLEKCLQHVGMHYLAER